MRGLAALLSQVTIVGMVIWAVWFWGGYEPVNSDVQFSADAVGDDPDGYLRQRESQIANIRPGVEKRIVWAGSAGDSTDLAMVYIHGFSATSEEIRPIPDDVARHFNANLFFTRLAGHGRDSDAMGEPGVADWIADLDEALAIGRRIGRRILLVGTSTGGTLITAVADDAERMQDVSGIVLISPNFGIKNPVGRVLTWPGARYWAPMLFGSRRKVAPENEGHAKYWTTEYPSVAVLPMAALVKYANTVDVGSVGLPALFIYSREDQVVKPEATARIASLWGGPKRIERLKMGPDDSASSHVIAGDIFSPGQNERVTSIITSWVEGLQSP